MGGTQSIPATGACVAGNITYAGRVCSMQCGVDYAGGDYKQTAVNSYVDCLQACASDTMCTDSQFDQQSNVCFLKSILTTPRGLPYIDSAVCYVQQGVQGSSSQSSSLSSTASTLTVTATITTTATSTTTAISTTTAVSTEIDISTTTAVSLQTVTSTTTSISRETDITTTTAISTVTATLNPACPSSSSSLVPSLCTFTLTSTSTTYTSTTTKITYTLPTKCYNTAVIQSLQPPATTSSSPPGPNTFTPTVYACSATTQVISVTTVTAVATSYKQYSWPFYVQAQNVGIDNGSYGRVVTYDSRVGNSFMQFTAPAHGPATQYQLDDHCVLGLGWNTSNPDWVSADEGSDGLVYFGTPSELGQPQYSTNTSCAVSAASVLTCTTSYGNTTYLTGNDTNLDQFNNVLNVAAYNSTKNIFGNTFYPVTLALTFL